MNEALGSILSSTERKRKGGIECNMWSCDLNELKNLS